MTDSKNPITEFEITEKPIPLHAWKPEDSQESLRVIEQDIRNLMRRLAEVQFSHAEQEKQQAEKMQRLLLALVEVTDAFARVFRNIHAKEELVTPQMKIWSGNFRSVCRLLESVLSEQGVVKLDNLDAGFDPRWHKPAGFVDDPTKAEGTIVEEVLRGYLWQNQLLRKAEVIVVRHAGEDAEEPGD